MRDAGWVGGRVRVLDCCENVILDILSLCDPRRRGLSDPRSSLCQVPC